MKLFFSYQIIFLPGVSILTPGGSKMVAGAIAAIGILVVIIFFNKDIGNFLREFKPLAPVEDAGKAIEQAGKDAGTSFGTTILRPINISFLETKLEKQAISEGFKPTSKLTAKQSKELALDGGDFIIGGKQKEVNAGLIGDKLPTDPSQFFIDNASTLLTGDQLARFQAQQQKKLGGQTAIGTNTTKTFAKTSKEFAPLDKTINLFTGFGESFQQTITGGKLFSELF